MLANKKEDYKCRNIDFYCEGDFSEYKIIIIINFNIKCKKVNQSAIILKCQILYYAILDAEFNIKFSIFSEIIYLIHEIKWWRLKIIFFNKISDKY